LGADTGIVRGADDTVGRYQLAGFRSRPAPQNIALIPGVADTQRTPQGVGKLVVGLGKSTHGGVIKYAIAACIDRSIRQFWRNTRSKNIGKNTKGARAGDFSTGFTEIINAGDPLQVIAHRATELELLAELLLIPDTAKGQQIDRYTIQVDNPC